MKIFKRQIGGTAMRSLLMIGLLAASPRLSAGDQTKPGPPSAASIGAAVFGESDYRLGPEDVVEVFVWKQPDLSTTVVIRPDGKVSVPLLGELEATGKT